MRFSSTLHRHSVTPLSLSLSHARPLSHQPTWSPSSAAPSTCLRVCRSRSMPCCSSPQRRSGQAPQRGASSSGGCGKSRWLGRHRARETDTHRGRRGRRRRRHTQRSKLVLKNKWRTKPADSMFVVKAHYSKEREESGFRTIPISNTGFDACLTAKRLASLILEDNIVVPETMQ